MTPERRAELVTLAQVLSAEVRRLDPQHPNPDAWGERLAEAVLDEYTVNWSSAPCPRCGKVKTAESSNRAAYLMAFHLDRRHRGWTDAGQSATDAADVIKATGA